MKILSLSFLALTALFFNSCENHPPTEQAVIVDNSKDTAGKNFVYQTEQFADVRILRYQITGFDELNPQQKELLYYLYQAALSGRDIIWDQNNKHNLTIRRTIEAILNSQPKDTSADYKNLLVYAKRIWISNGIHHHYSNDKILPEFSKEYFAGLLKKLSITELPLLQDESVDQFSARIVPVIFDPLVMPKKVNLNAKIDMVKASSTNFYEGVTQHEVEKYYASLMDKSSKTPISYGLNSKVFKENGIVKEKIWKLNGMYSQAIEKIIYWLEKATVIAENDKQKAALTKLIKFYQTGDLHDFDAYCIAWVSDTDSRIDVVNGFIEVYGDPLGYKGSFESIVSIKDMEASKRISAIGNEAQWFEDHSPLLPEHKKKKVTGISAKVITVVVEAGDAAPTTPIGINLPNTEWIREVHGSKSVNLGNIVDAYDNSKSTGLLNEFYYSQEEIDRAKTHASYADKLHTDMHEVIGHASGQINKGVGSPNETLKNYASTLEEARADLVALYYLMDQKLIDIGVMESVEVGKAAYDDYIINGLMIQLNRLKPGDNLEEAHMRNRQTIAKWVFEKGQKENVIAKKMKDGKTFFVVNDYEKLRILFGDLLREIQRIKSEGDYKAGKDLIENYGVKVDLALHKEVLERYHKLKIAPYAGFINPKLMLVMEGDKIIDVKVEYPLDFSEQMLYLGKNYSFLPNVN